MNEIEPSLSSVEAVDNFIFEGWDDRPLRNAISKACAGVPSWVNKEESMRLREVMNSSDDPEKRDEARKELVSYCFPTLLQALGPLWGGRFGISDDELFTFGLETVDRLVRSWEGKHVLRGCVSKGGLQSRLETYICKKNGLPGTEKNLPVIETFWSCVRDSYQENSRFPCVEEVEAMVKEANEREEMGLRLIGPGGVGKVFSIYQRFIGISITEADERGEKFSGPEGDAFRGILYDKLMQAVDSLKPKEKQAILLWMEADTKTASQVMGYGQEWIRRLIEKALKKLRHPYRSGELRNWREEY